MTNEPGPKQKKKIIFMGLEKNSSIKNIQIGLEMRMRAGLSERRDIFWKGFQDKRIVK